MKKTAISILIAVILAAVPMSAAFADRTQSTWLIDAGNTYTFLANPLNVLISGINKYLNFGTFSGSTGYGLRDNGGTMQFKNSGGSWTGFGTGGGGSGGGTFSTTTSTVPGHLTNSPNNNTDIVTIGSNSTTSAPIYFDPNLQSSVLGVLATAGSFTATSSTPSTFPLINTGPNASTSLQDILSRINQTGMQGNYKVAQWLGIPYHNSDNASSTLSGFGLFHGSSYGDGYFWAGALQSPTTTILRVGEDDVTNLASTTITGDLCHNGIGGMTFVPSTHSVYSACDNGAIYKTNTFTLATSLFAQSPDFVVSVALAAAPNITNDGTYLYNWYATSTPFTATVQKIRISDGATVAQAWYPSCIYPHDIEYDGGILWATGVNASPCLAKINASDLTATVYTSFVDSHGTGLGGFTDDIAVAPSYVYLGLEGFNFVLKVSKANPNSYSIIYTGHPSYAMYYQGGYVWDGSNNSYDILRIDPTTNTVADFPLDDAYGVPNEIVGNGSKLFWVDWSNPSAVHIASPANMQIATTSVNDSLGNTVNFDWIAASGINGPTYSIGGGAYTTATQFATGTSITISGTNGQDGGGVLSNSPGGAISILGGNGGNTTGAPTTGIAGPGATTTIAGGQGGKSGGRIANTPGNGAPVVIYGGNGGTITNVGGTKTSTGGPVVLLPSFGYSNLGILNLTGVGVNTYAPLQLLTIQGTSSPAIDPFGVASSTGSLDFLVDRFGATNANYFVATSTTATSTFAGSLDIGTTTANGVFSIQGKTTHTNSPVINRYDRSGTLFYTMDDEGHSSQYIYDNSFSTIVGRIDIANPGTSPGMSIYDGSDAASDRFNFINEGTYFNLGFDANGRGKGGLNIVNNGNVNIGDTKSVASRLSVNGLTTGLNFTATSTTVASTFPYASTTMVTASLMYKTGAFSIASSTTWTGSTTEQQLFSPIQAETWLGATCNTLSAGTVDVQFYNNSAKLNMIPASSTPAYFSFTTNNSIAALATTTYIVGTPASSPTSVTCTIKRLAPAN